MNRAATWGAGIPIKSARFIIVRPRRFVIRLSIPVTGKRCGDHFLALLGRAAASSHREWSMRGASSVATQAESSLPVELAATDRTSSIG